MWNPWTLHGRYDLELDHFAMLSTHTRVPWDEADAVQDDDDGACWKTRDGLRVLFSILIILVPMKLIWMTTTRLECGAVWLVGCRERG